MSDRSQPLKQQKYISNYAWWKYMYRKKIIEMKFYETVNKGSHWQNYLKIKLLNNKI